MNDMRKYINIVTEARIPGKYTYKDEEPEQEENIPVYAPDSPIYAPNSPV